jgi:hypothetical protein
VKEAARKRNRREAPPAARPDAQRLRQDIQLSATGAQDDALARHRLSVGVQQNRRDLALCDSVGQNDRFWKVNSCVRTIRCPNIKTKKA